MRVIITVFALIAFLPLPAFTDTGGDTLTELAREALSEDRAAAATAIERLRALGPSGLRVLFEANADRINALRTSAAAVSPDEDRSWGRLAQALDAVSAQRDSYASGLYWHTDMEQAKAAARASGKPILSLRLLGRLDEDLSCANSRFFRVTLYANESVSRILSENFVLHWKSVRPVPKVIIDFGDGRKLERTLTGNSIHYVLDSEGRVVDALPGLYGPRAFARLLFRAAQAAKTSGELSGEARTRFLRDYHTKRVKEIDLEWSSDLRTLGAARSLERAKRAYRPFQRTETPTAERAVRAAITKMVVVERPILRGITFNRKALEETTDEAMWNRIGELHAADAELDSNTLTLIKHKSPGGAYSLDERLQNLQHAIATDSARNEYLFHRTLHEWLAASPLDLDAFNERVYSELFLTPSSDPWLGLFPGDSYTGIENEGIKR